VILVILTASWLNFGNGQPARFTQEGDEPSCVSFVQGLYVLVIFPAILLTVYPTAKLASIAKMNPAAIPHLCDHAYCAANNPASPPRRMTRRRVNTKIKTSLIIFAREFSACLCFWKMEWMDTARLKSKTAMPSAGTVEEKNRLAARMESRRKREIRWECFWRKESMLSLLTETN